MNTATVQLNSLYYVTAYSHRLNQYVRYLATSKDEAGNEAVAGVKDALGEDYRIRSVAFICRTCDSVFREL